MTINNNEFITLQLESLAIRYFIIKYDAFEKTVKEIFSNNISSISPENKNLLYFYLAGLKRSSYIDYEKISLKTDDLKFSKTEAFSGFSLSNIIKIQEKNHLLDIFNFNIPSLTNKSTEYPFTECCKKLLNMRNKLAHEMSRLTFKNNDIIEVLTSTYIKELGTDWFSTLDTDLMNDETKYIFSNLIMLERIFEQLKNKVT
ncbi:MAG: hypothetical protein IJ325_11525 [Clostridia bacterium]|nr:hypothetical protein [Clostridia bacterium]